MAAGMTIAEFFAKIGIKIEGGEQMKALENSMVAVAQTTAQIVQNMQGMVGAVKQIHGVSQLPPADASKERERADRTSDKASAAAMLYIFTQVASMLNRVASALDSTRSKCTAPRRCVGPMEARSSRLKQPGCPGNFGLKSRRSRMTP